MAKVLRSITLKYLRDSNVFTVMFKVHCEPVSRAKTVGLRDGQLNATRSIAAGRKILDRAVKSVM